MIFNNLYERDIDLLIIEEFLCNREFSKLFTEKVKISSNYERCVAYHSQFNQYGESDITFILEYADKKVGILIEDKINAPSMYLQSQRYTMRAEIQKNKHLFDEWFIFLVAPKKYITEHQKDPNSDYRLTVTYEEMGDFFLSCGDKRSLHKNMMLLYAVQKKDRKAFSADKDVSDFWNCLRNYCCDEYPNIEMVGDSTSHGSSSCWPEFRSSLSGTKIIYKSDKGYIDLQFNNCSNIIDKLQEKLSPMLQESMKICKTGKSASLRVRNKSWIIDFHSNFESNIDSISEILDNVLMMVLFSLQIKKSNILKDVLP